MTKDEGERIARLEQKITDFIQVATPIFDALNGPRGWFSQMESRMNSQEHRSGMTFKIFGGVYAVTILIFSIVLAAKMK